MTTPTGLPYWARNTSAEDYGGIASKVDYQTPGAVNGRTDITAAQFLRLCADLSGVARTAPVAMAQWKCNDSPAAAPTVAFARAGSAASVVPYAGDAPPSGCPTLTRLGNGGVRLLLPSGSADAFGVVTTLDPDVWIPSLTSAAGSVSVERAPPSGGSNPLMFDIFAFNTSGVALVGPTLNIVFW